MRWSASQICGGFSFSSTTTADEYLSLNGSRSRQCGAKAWIAFIVTFGFPNGSLGGLYMSVMVIGLLR